MALARRGSAGYKKKTRRRKGKRGTAVHYAKKFAYGTLAGLAIAIPLTLAGRHFQSPELIEAGQRGGAIVASAAGGPVGQVGYQVSDALFDRFVMYQGKGVSGGSQVYL